MRRDQGEQFPMGSREDLVNRFVYHAPGPVHRDRHDEIRTEILSAANVLCELVPSCREKALMLTKLEEVSFWAHAATARIEIPEEVPEEPPVPKGALLSDPGADAYLKRALTTTPLPTSIPEEEMAGIFIDAVIADPKRPEFLGTGAQLRSELLRRWRALHTRFGERADFFLWGVPVQDAYRRGVGWMNANK